MRILLKILALIICVYTGLVGGGGVLLFLAALVPLVKKFLGITADLNGLYPLLVGAVCGFLGLLIASRALRHLIHPDAGTVRDVIGTALFLIIFGGVYPLGVKLHAPGWLLLAAFVGLYIFHRTLVKRVNAQASPPDGAPPTSAPAA